MQSGILNWNVEETPIAVIDVETTGLNSNFDRIVEISIVHINPNDNPKLVFDTLINPSRRVTATDIHGITDEDVVDAPKFEDVSGEIVNLLYNRVIASYNIYFDIKFICFELQRLGVNYIPPHLCLMHLRPMLGIGERLPLSEACKLYGLKSEGAHISACDAIISAKLWFCYLDYMRQKRIQRFADLANLKKYKFVESFRYIPLAPPLGCNFPKNNKTKSRFNKYNSEYKSMVAPGSKETKSRQEIRMEYYEDLKNVLSDLMITNSELEYLKRRKIELGLTEQEVKSLHAFIFSSVLSDFIKDGVIDESEEQTLHLLSECFRKLGWFPGQ
ncbi:MAG: 3'-5' exonuclease [Verrucomicrobiia bacterium]